MAFEAPWPSRRSSGRRQAASTVSHLEWIVADWWVTVQGVEPWLFKWIEMDWNGLKWIEMAWMDEIKWDQMRSNEIKWDQIRWWIIRCETLHVFHKSHSCHSCLFFNVITDSTTWSEFATCWPTTWFRSFKRLLLPLSSAHLGNEWFSQAACSRRPKGWGRCGSEVWYLRQFMFEASTRVKLLT